MKANVLSLVDFLIENNITVKLHQDNLKFSGDISVLSEQQVQQLQASKADLIQWLKSQQTEQVQADQSQTPIEALDRTSGVFPASSAQQHLWFIDSF
ncbi:MAG: hypothetical protein MJK04_05410, partial [Psychrosphaera sp.]|nr:hypothetical protein [Psychrosphaera sp.]